MSEKSYAAYDANVYTFVVAPDANKIEIKHAVESIFSVKVTNVNTLNRKGKRKRNRRTGDLGQAHRPEAGDRDPRRGRPHRDLRELTMPIRKRKPTSPGRRFQTVSDFSEITQDEARASLVEAEAAHRRPQLLRPHDRAPPRRRPQAEVPRRRLPRDKDGVPAKVAAIEYDPNRNARIALLHYLDGEKRYILAPTGVEVGDLLQSGQGSEIRPGNALPLRYIPVGTTVHNVELKPGAGGKIGPRRRRVDPARRQGRRLRHAAAPVHRDAPGADRLPGHGRRGRQRRGRRSSRSARPAATAGRASARTTRGVAMNPVDHPLGGGEGKSSGGRHPVSPWGKPEGRTRKKGKPSDELIIRAGAAAAAPGAEVARCRAA